MASTPLTPLRDELDEWLASLSRIRPSTEDLCDLVDLLSDATARTIRGALGQLPDAVAHHLAAARTAARQHEIPVIIRQIDAAIAGAERHLAIRTKSQAALHVRRSKHAQ